MANIQVLRVETSSGSGMYSGIWYQNGLPCDKNHPLVSEDSLYVVNLKRLGYMIRNEPQGHRFGFLDLKMLRRWIYKDEWIETLDHAGAVLCVYDVPVDLVIVGRTQLTFEFEKAVCLSRKPLATVLLEC